MVATADSARWRRWNTRNRENARGFKQKVEANDRKEQMFEDTRGLSTVITVAPKNDKGKSVPVPRTTDVQLIYSLVCRSRLISAQSQQEPAVSIALEGSCEVKVAQMGSTEEFL